VFFDMSVTQTPDVATAMWVGVWPTTTLAATDGSGVGVAVGAGVGPPVNGPHRSFEPEPTRIATEPAAEAVRMAVILAAGTASDFAILPADVDLCVGATHRVEPGAAHIPLVIVTG
jgi:hypothetical protein